MKCIKISLLTILFLLRFIQGFSQTLLDSLYLELADIKNDTIKVDLLNKITREFRIDNPKKAFEFNTRALSLAKELNYKPGIARSYELLGTIYRYLGNYTNSLDFYYNANEIYIQLNDSLNIAHVYNYIGQVYHENNDLKKALSYNIKAYELFKAIKNYKGIAIMCNNLGICYYSINEDSLALEYYEQAFEMNKKINRKSGIGLACTNIGNVYLKQGFNTVAKGYYLKSLKYLLDANDLNNLALANFNIGNVYINLNKLDSANFYLSESYAIASNHSLLETKKVSILGLSSVCKAQGKYLDAINYMEEYFAIQDSLLDETLTSKILSVEKKMQFEQAIKNQEFDLCEKSRKLKISALQKYILLIILLSVIIISWILFNRKAIKIKFANEKLQLKDNELINFSMYILQKNDLIHEFRQQLIRLHKRLKIEENKKIVDEIINSLIFKIAISKDIEEFRDKLRNISKDFYTKLEQKYPDLTDKEKQLAVLLRLNLSSKQIGVILNNTSRSIDTSRYMLRKKIGLDPIINLSEFFNSI